jgi:chromosome partitioning protein
VEERKNIFVFCNQKGGVGKTTTVVNMATALGQKKLKILALDMDPQGNLSSGFGISKNDLKSSVYDVIVNEVPLESVVIKDVIANVDVLPANSHLAGAEIELISVQGREFLLKGILSSVSALYDFILIDCPPSLGLLTINALVAAHKLLIPLQCEYYALEGLGQLLNTFNLIKERLNKSLELGGVVLTMADFRTNLTQQVIDEVKNFFGEKVFSTVIPRSVKLSEAPGFGKPAIIYEPNSRGALSYQLLTKEFLVKFSTDEKKQQNELPQKETSGQAS